MPGEGDGLECQRATATLVSGYFTLADLGELTVKGVRDPMRVYELRGLGELRTRLDVAHSRGFTQLVGRSDEVAALESALQRALEGTGRVAAVVGEAGVGKSRLCAEFVERCRVQGLSVYEAHCPAHGRTVPYLPLLELLRNLFGISEQDGPLLARREIAGELSLLDEGFADDSVLVFDFLGIADPEIPMLQLDPVVRQRRLFERAGLVRLRGDAAGMDRDLAEARRLFAQTGVTGWDDYARSIEA